MNPGHKNIKFTNQFLLSLRIVYITTFRVHDAGTEAGKEPWFPSILNFSIAVGLGFIARGRGNSTKRVL